MAHSPQKAYLNVLFADVDKKFAKYRVQQKSEVDLFAEKPIIIVVLTVQEAHCTP